MNNKLLSGEQRRRTLAVLSGEQSSKAKQEPNAVMVMLGHKLEIVWHHC